MSYDVIISSSLRNSLLSLKDSSKNSENKQATETKTPPRAQNAKPGGAGVTVDTTSSDLGRVLDNINQSIQTITRANEAINEIENLVKEANETASEAQSSLKDGADRDAIKTLENAFNETRENITNTAQGADFKGKNILAGDSLQTDLGSGPAIITEGQNLSAEGLGLKEARFDTIETIAQSLGETQSALVNINIFSKALLEDLQVIQTRGDFAQKTISTFQTGAIDNKIGEDASEEGVNLLALKTRQALENSSLSLSSSKAQEKLRLF